MEDEKVLLVEMSLMERILRIINEIRIEKAGKNTFQNYEYFKLEDIFFKANPLFEKYKILPKFTTYFEKYETEQTEDINGKINTKFGYREIAELRYKDVFSKQDDLVYTFPIKDIDIKGANKMQCAGGIRTYAKRYLYMESLNISDDNLDLDSNEMAEKEKKKSVSKDTKIQEGIQKIRTKIDALRSAGATEKDLSEAIKSVYSDGGKPSANYTTCTNVEDISNILKALDKI